MHLWPRNFYSIPSGFTFWLQDYKELSVKLADVTVNMHTASELLRLSLRRTDHAHEGSDNSDESDEDEEDDVVGASQV